MRYAIILLALLIAAPAWGGLAAKRMLRVSSNVTTVTLTALPAGVGGVTVMRASDNAQLGATLTAAGQSVAVPRGTSIYAKSAQAQAWHSNWTGESYDGYLLTLTGATDGNQSIAAAEFTYSGGDNGSGAMVCQTGAVTANAPLSVALTFESGN